MGISARVGIRWTIGDVSSEGFDALALSIAGAHRVFGASARYAVCYNSLPLSTVMKRVGALPCEVKWLDATGLVPAFVKERFDANMAEGVAWKLAPLQLFPDRHELSLDNDCILWELPLAMRRWLEDGDRLTCLLAEDARACFGSFAPLCGAEPRNAGIRGLPPGFSLERALRETLRAVSGVLSSELDEQGLQVASLSRHRAPGVVTLSDVTICSPFPPHSPHLGRCGAHFVGLNARELAWQLHGRPASEYVRRHWQRLRSEIHARLAASPPESSGETSLEVRGAEP